MSITIKQPLGVCTIIIPWNSPTLMLAKTIGPALITGNTVIVKPAEQTSLSALYIAHLSTLIHGFPSGVLNVLPGDGKVGAALVRHMDVDKITFTGSTEVGQSILVTAAQTNLKRVTLELGGKSPLIVCEDARVEEAARLACQSLFVSNGQVCCCASRTYVHESLHDRFVEACKTIVEKRVLGDPFSVATEQGPQIGHESLVKIDAFVQSGIEVSSREVGRLKLGGA